MKILLDTHYLLWILFDEQKLSQDVYKLIEDRNNEIYVSVVSLWEIAIKNAKNEKMMPYNYEMVKTALNNSDFIILPIEDYHIELIKQIIESNVHQDPFDHMLISIASKENLSLLTHDALISNYKMANIIYM